MHSDLDNSNARVNHCGQLSIEYALCTPIVSHLESLVAEFLEWQGFLVRRNTKVGRLAHGGWEMELDVVGFHPQERALVHYELSLDALSWQKRETRYRKKFEAGHKYILNSIFAWLPTDTELRQVAVLVSHPPGRDTIGGGQLISVDELMAEVKSMIMSCGPMIRNAIPEQYPLLRTIQLSHCGYQRITQPNT